MGNKRFTLSKINAAATVAALGLAIAPWMSGCSDASARQTLNRAYAELGSRQYDQADADADEFLRANSTGTGVGEAFYLKGRIEEQKAQDPHVSPSIVEKRRTWIPPVMPMKKVLARSPRSASRRCCTPALPTSIILKKTTPVP